MDCKFLTSQLLLMSNISENYLPLIPPFDWCRLIELAVEKEDYITRIIESETGPKIKKKASEAYSQFVDTVLDNKEYMAKAA